MKIEIIPKKSLGQSFLTNPGVLDKIINAAEISVNDTILEIGAGIGNLTEKLKEKANRVLTVEKDHRLIKMLEEKFENSNVEIIEGDILKLNIKALINTSRRRPSGKGSGYKIVANIPYYITSRLLRMIFEKWSRPKLIVLTVQKEVAKRIVAKPPNMNLLALSVQLYSEPKIIGYVSKGSFRPMPKVDSAIIRLTPHQAYLPEARLLEGKEFFKLMRAGFSEKRKQLINNLAKNFGMMKEDLLSVFEKVGINPDIRAEGLSLSQWIELSKLMKK